jgi:hypothetical protein
VAIGIAVGVFIGIYLFFATTLFGEQLFFL